MRTGAPCSAFVILTSPLAGQIVVMSRSDTRYSLPLTAGLGIFIPLALFVGASVGAKDGPEESVLPLENPAPKTTAPPAAATTDFRMLTLRAGEGPYPWAVAGRFARSFITNDPNNLELVASAAVAGRPEPGEQIEWEVSPPAGFQLPAGAQLQGPRLVLNLVRPDGNPTGGGDPLSLTVRAKVKVDGRVYTRVATLTQDLRDRLRQEYVDLERAYVPARSELLDEEQFKRAYGKKYAAVSFSELNWSRLPGREERYPVILATEDLLRTIQQTRKLYGRPVEVSSGFRNPVRQVEVHGTVAESHHQYGRAVDLYVAPDSAPPKTGRTIATEGDWLRLAASTLRGGGVWIEPMLDCHVNTDGCHVHVDVRESGTRSEIAQVSGKVTDPAGLPVPGATVRLAGMLAITNAWGAFTLKHVLTPKEYDLTVEAPGRGIKSQKITIGGELATVALRMPADPNPALVARTGETQTGANGKVSVRIFVRNAGPSAAIGLRLAAASSDRPSRGLVSPAHLPLVGPGQETAIQLELPSRPAVTGVAEMGNPMPVLLTASYRNPAGETRGQALRLNVPMPESPPTQPAKEPARAPAATPTSGPDMKQGNPDLGAAAGGLVLGAAAAAGSSLVRRRSKRTPEPLGESSVDPAQGQPEAK